MKRLCFVFLLASMFAGTADAQEPIRVLANVFDPFCYEVNGELVGLEYEILQFFAKSKGRDLELTWVDAFENLLPTFERGDFDIAAGTLTITAERDEKFDFSSSYFPVRVILVEPREYTTKRLPDLSGETLVMTPGTTYEEILRRVPRASLVYVPDEVDALDALNRGEARATLIDTMIGLMYMRDYPKLHMTLAVSEEQHYGFAVQEGSTLAQELSRHIRELKSSGIYFRLLEKYLGTEAVEMVQAARE